MELAASFVTSMFGGGATAGAAASAGAAATTAGATTAGAAASSGFSLAKLLSGTATVFSAVQSLGAGEADAQQAELAAMDAERQKPLETLQGLNRRTGIKAEMMDRVGQQDVANAASGVDLSFGTPGQARREAFRQGDLALETDMGTQQTRVSRLDEQAANYRKRAKRARTSGRFDAALTAIGGYNKLADIG